MQQVTILTFQLFFILTDQSAVGGPAVWAELEQETYFNEYNIEGVSQVMCWNPCINYQPILFSLIRPTNHSSGY